MRIDSWKSRTTRHTSWLAILLVGAARISAQEDGDELIPGLVARYTVGSHSVERIEGGLAFNWKNQSPDLRLPAGPFSARWTGRMLLQAEGRYRWHAYLSGTLTVRLNQTVVLAGQSNEPRWITGEEVSLAFGELPLEIDYESSNNGRLFLAWSSDLFPLEPAPQHMLFHEHSAAEPGPIPAAAEALLQQRCTRCHGDVAGLTALPGPSLANIGVETSPDWLLDQIQHGGGKHGHMPQFGLTRAESAAILAALESQVQPAELAPNNLLAEAAPKDIEAGRELLTATGCLACHQWNQQGRTTGSGGPPLDDVAKHRTVRWLEQWLTEPGKLNPDHQMPVFTLTADERRQMISALVASRPAFAVSRKEIPTPESLQLGERLIRAARCAACHELPGEKREHVAAPQWPEMKLADDGCWATAAMPQSRRPHYGNRVEQSLRNFLTATRNQAIHPSADLAGQMLLRQKGCVNCHDRDGSKGLSAMAAALAGSMPNLHGRAPWLIPPSLTAIGDRLPDARLASAVRGEIPRRRLDWLLVRMPKYRHSEREQAALVSHLIAQDRIPDSPPAMPEYPLTASQQDTLAGRELLGGKGFSCVACHPVKDFIPKNVALGTRGSNLFQISDRLRPEYFFRWTRSPLRVMPGVEMPSYLRPHAMIFPGDLNRQLASIWTALNDPDLPTPVNPGSVEQYWTVGPNDRPRILRDVVTLPGKKQTTVPRAFAVGFPNGHNILFDLDTASIRAWTIGDFAQQRAQGKSWFWDLVGTPVMVHDSGESDFVIFSADRRTKLFPAESATIRLLYFEIDPEKSVRFHYLLRGVNQGRKFEATVIEVWSDSQAAFNRRVFIETTEESSRLQVFLLEPVSQAVRQSGTVQAESRTASTLLPQEERPAYRIDANNSVKFLYAIRQTQPLAVPPVQPAAMNAAENITVVPGFLGQRLPYPRNIMPTAITFDPHGRLFFTSLRGHVYSGNDREAQLFAEGLAAPFGILNSLGTVLVAHKPEILALEDDDGDGRADHAAVIATGWGLTDDYHDWTAGLVRDAEGNLFTTLGSDYAHKNRPKAKSQWRGHALKIDPAGRIESLASGIRYSTGLAMTSQQHLFLTDQQGLQNTFNELNWLAPGLSSGRASFKASSPADQTPSGASKTLRFGVPGLHEPDKDAPGTPPAVQIPHQWTRSVNGIAAMTKPLADRTHPKLFDHLIGCEYDNRFLVRFSHQLVDGVMQGAVYPFSKPTPTPDSSTRRESSAAPQTPDESRSGKGRAGIQETGFLGPLSIAVSPDGDLYVGSIHDSGWQGGLNTGDVVKLSPQGTWPNGLCEIRATPSGFDLEFFHPVDSGRAEESSRYQISGYTRVWQGSYATPDSNRHQVEVTAVKLSADGTVVSLTLAGLKPGHVYDVSVGDINAGDNTTLWPNIGHYTLHRLPRGN